MTRSSLRVGLLGSTGRWGSQILRVLKPLCHVIPCPTRLQTDSMLADKSIDAVVIATPIETHAALAETALLAGKHVFVEKPMTTTVESAERLMYLAEAKGKTLFVGHIFIYHPVFERLQQIVSEDEIEHIRFVWRKFGTFDSDLIWNLASHEVSLAVALCREGPVRSAVLYKSGLVTETDALIAEMFVNDTKCLIDLDRCSPEDQKVVTVKLLHSGENWIWNGQSLLELSQSGTERLVFESAEEPLAREMDAFLTACSSGPPSVNDGRHELKVVQILSAIRSMNRRFW